MDLRGQPYRPSFLQPGSWLKNNASSFCLFYERVNYQIVAYKMIISTAGLIIIFKIETRLQSAGFTS